MAAVFAMEKDTKQRFHLPRSILYAAVRGRRNAHLDSSAAFSAACVDDTNKGIVPVCNAQLPLSDSDCRHPNMACMGSGF